VRDTVFLPYQKFQRSVRDERWKLIVYPQLSYWQLFDLQNDPHERRNLIERKEHAPHVARLLAQMKTWQAKVGDTQPLPTERKAAPKIDLTGKARKPDQWQPEWIVKKYFGDAQ
jgi:arylsulfatase A-like enzyme